GESTRPVVALALGGGAARGLAHIGVLRVFEEEGIPVDIVVGTSMGSVVGGLYSSGLSIANIEWAVTNIDLAQLFVASSPLKGGFVRTDLFERFIDFVTDQATFDDTVIPFYSVAANLRTGEEKLIHSGRLSRGILASMSIPGMFPAVEINGEYYVDGGVTSLIPVVAAYSLGADVVIAVDVRSGLGDINPNNAFASINASLSHMLNANARSEERRV